MAVYPSDEVLLNVIRPDYERPAPPPPVEPLYDLDIAGKVRGKHYFFSKTEKLKQKEILTDYSFAQTLCFVCF